MQFKKIFQRSDLSCNGAHSKVVFFSKNSKIPFSVLSPSYSVPSLLFEG